MYIYIFPSTCVTICFMGPQTAMRVKNSYSLRWRVMSKEKRMLDEKLLDWMERVSLRQLAHSIHCTTYTTHPFNCSSTLKPQMSCLSFCCIPVCTVNVIATTLLSAALGSVSKDTLIIFHTMFSRKPCLLKEGNEVRTYMLNNNLIYYNTIN